MPQYAPLPKKLKVLVVDDCESTQEVLQTMLQTSSYQVDVVSSGAAAIAALQAVSGGDDQPGYDLILMDWRMPGLDGVETTRRIRADERLGKAPIIVMVTAYGSDEVRHRAMQAGMEGFLVKPVTTSSLHEVIQLAFGQHTPLEKPALQSHASALAGLRVLMVDDSAISREMVGAMLAAVDVDYAEAENGEVALQQLDDFRYDLVLMDVEMPKMDGQEATRHIRAQSRFAELPIILMSAHDVADVKGAFLEAGANDGLTKPIEPAVLYQVLQAWDKRPTAMPGQPDFSGARVLIIDDVLANRALLRELLEDVGIEVSEAENGRQGVDRATSENFDAVLTDIQMPLLDGYEATKQMRADPRLRDLPVIAVTAHALADDREKCLAAGMNDYLSKPVDPEKLYRLLEHYLPKPTAGAPLQRLPKPPTAPDYTPLPQSNATLDVEWGLDHVMGKRALYQKLLLRFLEEHSEDHTRLSEALARHDLAALGNIAHALTGVAGGIGARALLDAARQLEVPAMQGDAPTCARMLAKAIEAHQAVFDVLTQYKATLVSQTVVHKPGAIAAETIAQLLSGLAYRLENGDSRIQNYIPLLESGALGAKAPPNLLKAIACIKVFDFDNALAALQAFAAQRAIVLLDCSTAGYLRQAEDCLVKGDIDGCIRILTENPVQESAVNASTGSC